MPAIWRPQPTRPPWQPQPVRKPLPATAAAGTTYTLTVPGTTSGPAGVASGNFTVTPNGTITSVITPNDGGAGGTFTPSSLTFTASSAAQTFTYTPGFVSSTPGVTAVRTVACTNSTGLTDPGSVTYTAKALARSYFLGDSITGDSSSTNNIIGTYLGAQIMSHLRDDWFDPGYFSAIPGTKIENFFGYSPAPSTFVNAAAPANVCHLLGGTNNILQLDSAATAYTKLQSAVATLKGYGFKVIVCTLVSGDDTITLTTGQYDTIRDAFNALVRANWRSFADGFIDYAANQIMGKDGSYTNATYYMDTIHPTHTGDTELANHAVGPILDAIFPGGTGGGSVVQPFQGLMGVRP